MFNFTLHTKLNISNVRRECPGMVADDGWAGFGKLDRDHVEAPSAIRHPKTAGQLGGEIHDLALLGGGHVKLRRKRGVGGPGFDFNRDQRAVGSQGDKIKLAVTAAQVPRQHPVAMFFEMLCREAFARPAPSTVLTPHRT